MFKAQRVKQTLTVTTQFQGQTITSTTADDLWLVDGVGEVKRHEEVSRSNGVSDAVDIELINSTFLARKDFGDSENCGEEAGDPIQVGTGNSIQRQTDYAATNSLLMFERTYNSLDPNISSIGAGWRHNYDERVDFAATASPRQALVTLADGKTFTFTEPTGASGSSVVWTGDPDVVGKLIPIYATGTVPTGWKYQTEADHIKLFDTSGRLTRVVRRDGQEVALAYDALGTLSSATDSFGRQLTFNGASLASVGLPDGFTVGLGYDANQNLAGVTFPGGKSLAYRYNEPARMGGADIANALTSIVDETAIEYAAWNFDADGRAVSSEHAGGVGKTSIAYTAAGQTTVTDAAGTLRAVTWQPINGRTKATGMSSSCSITLIGGDAARTHDANGNITSRTDFNGNQSCHAFDLTRNLETTRIEGRAAGSVCPANPATYVPAAGTVERKLTMQWHPDWRVKTREAEPKRITTWVYNGQPDPTSGSTAAVTCAPTSALVDGKPIGVLCRKIVQATTDASGAQGLSATATGAPRKWQYTYNAVGQVLTVDGPRTDVSNITTYQYYATTDTANPPAFTRGDLQQVTNALGQVTRFMKYDRNGRVLVMTDRNSVTSAYTYHPRGWLTSRTIDVKTTTADYTDVGLIKKITWPDGSSAAYTYDPARRLTAVTDGAGRKVGFTLDGAGKRIGDTYVNPDGTIARTVDRRFDALSRLSQTAQGSRPFSVFDYFGGGELKTATTPKGDATSFTLDELNRTKTVRDAIYGATQPTTLAYDGLDQLIRVAAPNGAVTAYAIDGLGNVQQEDSADRGTTVMTLDDAGNPKTRRDARGITVTYAYDALNRVTSISYADPTENVTLTWDTATGCTFGVGRLCRVADAGGSTSYAFDARGNMLTETRAEAGQSYATGYAPTAADRLQQEVVPTGETTTYRRDASGKVSNVDLGSGAQTTTVAANIVYQADGQVASQQLGAVSDTRVFDSSGLLQTATAAATVATDVPLPLWALGLLGGLLSLGLLRNRRIARGSARGWIVSALLSIALSLLIATPAFAADLTLQFDANGNLQSRTTARGTLNFTHDKLDRLQTEAGPPKTQTFGYDAGSNRTSDASANYTLVPNSNRLATIGGQAVQHDAAGNLTQWGAFAYGWNQAGQLKTVTKNGQLLATYFYDFRSRRTRKVTTAAAPQGAQTVVFHWDKFDRLVGESLVSGTTTQALRTYVWRDEMPVAMVVHQPTRKVYTIQVDHLGSPWRMFDAAGNLAWEWTSEAFGGTAPNEDPRASGTKVSLNFRLPGQYADAESGLHYNWHRYYAPTIGRYVSSDPAGIRSGTNTYTYVKSNPISYLDPLGLYTEVNFWDPVGYGSSSFGHVSTNINGQNFSFGSTKFRVG